MAQLVVRDLDDDVKTRLRRRAKCHGRSMEEEVRTILRDAAMRDVEPVEGIGTRMRELFRGIELDQEIPEIRGRFLRPVSFKK